MRSMPKTHCNTCVMRQKHTATHAYYARKTLQHIRSMPTTHYNKCVVCQQHSMCTLHLCYVPSQQVYRECLCIKKSTKSQPTRATGSATHCTTLQHTAQRCNTLHNAATPEGMASSSSASDLQDRTNTSMSSTLQHIATHCNTLQHTATHCNTLQHTHHTATQRNLKE